MVPFLPVIPLSFPVLFSLSRYPIPHFVLKQMPPGGPLRGANSAFGPMNFKSGPQPAPLPRPPPQRASRGGNASGGQLGVGCHLLRHKELSFIFQTQSENICHDLWIGRFFIPPQERNSESLFKFLTLHKGGFRISLTQLIAVVSKFVEFGRVCSRRPPSVSHVMSKWGAFPVGSRLSQKRTNRNQRGPRRKTV